MITVRKASADDVPRILEIFTDSLSPVWTEASIQCELNKNDSFFLVSANGSAVLGFAVSRRVGEDGELLQIATDKNFRKTGVGDMLMCAILKHACEERYKAIHLEVRESNKAAIGLYEKHGFVSVRVRLDYYTAPVEDAIVMVRRLSE